MGKKILLAVVAIPTSGLISFLLVILYMLARELFEYGYLGKISTSDQISTQLGIVWIFTTIIMYGILVAAIFTRVKTTKKRR